MIYLVIKNFLTTEKCHNLIGKYENCTDELKQSTEIGNDKYARYDFKDNVLARELFGLFPKNFKNKYGLSFVSNLFYVSKYFPDGDSIDFHYDGHKEIMGKHSKLTFVIYLNDDLKEVKQ